MWIIKSEQRWVEEHAHLVEGEGWVCNKTKETIRVTEIGRSIHVFGMSGGSGEVRSVGHLHCPGCQPDWKPPTYGTPIQESLLAKVS